MTHADLSPISADELKAGLIGLVEEQTRLNRMAAYARSHGHHVTHFEGGVRVWIQGVHRDGTVTVEAEDCTTWDQLRRSLGY